jgi:hypothetical protein
VLFTFGLRKVRGETRRRLTGLLSLSGAILLGVLGYLAHPSQTYDRAGDRSFEADQLLIDYRRSQSRPYRDDPPDPPMERVRVEALNEIGAKAAHLEEAAIPTSRHGEWTAI